MPSGEGPRDAAALAPIIHAGPSAAAVSVAQLSTWCQLPPREPKVWLLLTLLISCPLKQALRGNFRVFSVGRKARGCGTVWPWPHLPQLQGWCAEVPSCVLSRRPALISCPKLLLLNSYFCTTREPKQGARRLKIFIFLVFFHGFSRSATPLLPVLFHLTPGPCCSLQQLPYHTPKVLELQRGTVLLLKLTPAACVAKKN